LAVGALIFGEEAKCSLPNGAMLANREHRQRIDCRVPAEEPAEARPIGGTTRQAIAGDEATAEIRVADVGLVEIDLRVLDGAVEECVRAFEGNLRGAYAISVGDALAPRALGRAGRR